MLIYDGGIHQNANTKKLSPKSEQEQEQEQEEEQEQEQEEVEQEMEEGEEDGSGIPSEPLGVRAEAINSTAVRISWRPPNNIDRKLNYYRLFLHYVEDNGNDVIKNMEIDPSINNFVVNNLPNATKIHVALTTIVGVGIEDAMIEEGEWSPTVTVHTPPVPSEPTNVTGYRLNATSVRVAWSKPMHPRGIINGYSVEYSYVTPNGYVRDSVPQMNPDLYQADIHDLPSEVSVDVTVRAHTLLSEPLGVRAEAINSTAVRISWLPPNNIDRKLNHYRLFLQYVEDDGRGALKNVEINPSINNIVVNDLPNATEIHAKLTTIVGAGSDEDMMEQGKWSPTVIAHTPPVPSKPTNVTGSRLNATSVRVAWSKPMHPRGTIDGYSIEYSYVTPNGYVRDSVPQMNPDLYQADIHDLPSEVSVDVTVRAHTPSFKIPDFTAEALNSSAIRLSWDLPLEDGEEMLTYMINIQFNGTDGSRFTDYHHVSPDDLTHVIGGLPADREIDVGVRIITESGVPYGNWSEFRRVKTYAVPSEPLDVRAEAINSTAVRISWRPPNDIDHKVYYYRMVLIYKNDDDGHGIKDIRIDPSLNHFVVNDLPNSTEIQVSLRTTVGFGPGDAMTEHGKWSPYVIVRTPPVPSEPTNVTGYRLNATSVRVAWSKPMHPRGTINGYSVEYSYVTPNGYVRDSVPQMNPDLYQADIHDLPSEVSVDVTVRAHTLPNEPLAVRAEAINSTALRISWRPPNNIDRKLNHYEMFVKYFTEDGSHVIKNMEIDPSVNTFVVNDLPNATEIHVTLTTMVRTGIETDMMEWGKWSPTVIAITPPAALEIYNFTAEALNSSAIWLSWGLLLEVGEEVPTYLINIQFNQTDGSIFTDDRYVSPEDLTHVIGDLPADREIDVGVRIITVSGVSHGNWSEFRRVKTYAVPNEPLGVRAEAINSTAVRISWRPPNNIDREVNHYRMFVQYVKDNGNRLLRAIEIDPSINNYVVNGLPKATEIHAKLTTIVGVGADEDMLEQGKWSPYVIVHTPPGTTQLHNASSVAPISLGPGHTEAPRQAGSSNIATATSTSVIINLTLLSLACLFP
nr:unnamed protein product [Spirometra erinaceieuropaei]